MMIFLPSIKMPHVQFAMKIWLDSVIPLAQLAESVFIQNV